MPKKEVDSRVQQLFGPIGLEAFFDVVASKLNRVETAAGIKPTTKDSLIDESLTKSHDITIDEDID